jgi:uncharacterized protein YcaQ
LPRASATLGEMNDDAPTLSNQDARRLAVRGALLSGDRLPADREGILAVVRGLGHLQIDPTRTVEKTHLLVLWSRLGAYDIADLDALLAERQLFEQNAFIFPREKLAERKFVMERGGVLVGDWQQRMRDWVAANEPFRQMVLRRLAAEGPLPSRAFAGETLTHWPSSGWTSGRNVTQMFEWLGARGQVMIAGRQGSQRVWDLPERVLPEFPATAPLSEDSFARLRIEGVTRRLGIASEREIAARTPYVGRAAAREAIDVAVEDGDLVAVSAIGVGGRAYTTPDALEALDAPDETRTTLLSPFDPLAKDRDRTLRLFGFHYRLEMYVPKAERTFGHYVLPILHDDRLVGRIDPLMDRRAGVFQVNGVHVEADAPMTRAGGEAVGRVIRDLGTWLGATVTRIGRKVPEDWRSGLVGSASDYAKKRRSSRATGSG